LFRKILCPTDLSERSLVSIRAAVDMARLCKSEIILLNIHHEFMDKGEMTMLRVSAEDFVEKEKDVAVTAKEKMEELLRKAGGSDLPHKSIIRKGEVCEQIVEEAESLGCNLVVISTTGRSHLREHLKGSEAERIVRASKVPVLVVPVKT
jgi:nucleotide-binding universal stress UspA family protein